MRISSDPVRDALQEAPNCVTHRQHIYERKAELSQRQKGGGQLGDFETQTSKQASLSRSAFSAAQLRKQDCHIFCRGMKNRVSLDAGLTRRDTKISQECQCLPMKLNYF